MILCNVSGKSYRSLFVQHLWCALFVFLACWKLLLEAGGILSLCFFLKNQIGDSIVMHACFTLFSLVMENSCLMQVEFELVQLFLKVRLEIVLLCMHMVRTVIFFVMHA